MRSKFIGLWCWLFPLTYACHIAEEYWGGFPAWASNFSGANLTPERFLSLNTTAWLIMALSVAIAVATPYGRWLVIAFGTIVLVNGTAHFLGSLITRSYSPGVISGVLLWCPLGGYTLYTAWRTVARPVWRAGVVVGLLLHAIIVLLALNGGR